MKTVFRARLKPDGPRLPPWTTIGGIMEARLSGRDLHVTLQDEQTYMVLSAEGCLNSWYIHEADLDLFESWVEWPEGAQLVASTYTAERFLPEAD